MKIAFFIRNCNERGGEVSMYDYADYNEKFLTNKSIIISFKKEKYIAWNPDHPFKDDVLNKFKNRFDVFQVDEFADIDDLLVRENVDLIYFQNGGTDNETYPFGYVYNTKTFIHCVFNTDTKYGNIYSPISDWLNKKFNTNYPVLPYMVHLGDTTEDLRLQLSIPKTAKVFGRHGGFTTFSIEFVKDIVKKVALENPDIYFLFLNTETFSENIPNIIYLPCTVDLEEKRRFINTCDAMLHGRADGETFGLSVAEFAICKKPIISYKGGSTVFTGKHYTNADYAHFDILGDKIIPYTNVEEVKKLLVSFDLSSVDMNNNGYIKYTPENVMKIFNDIITNN